MPRAQAAKRTAFVVVGLVACGGAAFQAGSSDGGASFGADASTDGRVDPDAPAPQDAPDGPCRNFALAFESSRNSFLVSASDPAVDAMTGLTIEAWIHPTSVSGERHILSHHDHGSGGGTGSRGFVLMLMGAALQFRTYDDAWRNANSGGTGLATNRWQHVAVSYDGTNVRFFVDGQPRGSQAMAPPAPYPAGYVTIGAAAYTDGFHFQGMMDEVRLSNTARYLAAFTPPRAPFANDANTVGLWHFDEGAGKTARSESGKLTMLLGVPDGGARDPAWVAVPCLDAPDR